MPGASRIRSVAFGMKREPLFVDMGIFTEQTTLSECMCHSVAHFAFVWYDQIRLLPISLTLITSNKILIRSKFLGRFVPFCCCPSSPLPPPGFLVSTYSEIRSRSVGNESVPAGSLLLAERFRLTSYLSTSRFLTRGLPAKRLGGIVCWLVERNRQLLFIVLALKVDDAADRSIFFCHRGAGPFVSLPFCSF